MNLSSFLNLNAQEKKAEDTPKKVHMKEEEKVASRKQKEIKLKAQETKVEEAKPAMFMHDFGRTLKKAELWLGNPGTGKTYHARNLTNRWKKDGTIDDYVVINCHEEMTLMSMFKTTKTDEKGNWLFILNKFFDMITDELQKRYVVVFDEFNTLPMSVMKAMQPIIDDSEGSFEFEENTYKKNPNVHYILTMNHDDLGISNLPEAILDRVRPKLFHDLTPRELSERTGVPIKLIKLLERIHGMFAHLGNLPKFHQSVRQLKYLYEADGNNVEDYIISQLELAHIDWKEAVAMSPEFKNVIQEFNDYNWK